MRVQASVVDYSECPEQVKPYVKPDQVFVTIGKQYEIHGIALFGCVLMLNIVDDLGYPNWNPSWLFDVVELTLPHDWECNLFKGDLGMVLGPEFVARDEGAYSRMVELDAEQVERFWKRLDEVKGDST